MRTRSLIASLAGIATAAAVVTAAAPMASATTATTTAYISHTIQNPEAPTTPAITRYHGVMLNYTLNGKAAQDWMGSYLVNGGLIQSLV